MPGIYCFEPLRPRYRKPLWFIEVHAEASCRPYAGYTFSMGDVIINPAMPPDAYPPDGYPLTALQSVACLLHWQVFLALAAHLSVKGRDELRHYLVSHPRCAAPSRGTSGSAAPTPAPAQRVQAAKSAAAKAHLECQRQMLKETPQALPETAPLGSAFSHMDYLSDAHFHMHWLVKERLPS